MTVAPYGYWIPKVSAPNAKADSRVQRILHVGPWGFVPHPAGGALAVLHDYPDKGQYTSKSPDDYGVPVECDDGLFFLPPKQPLTLYDLAHGERAGVDIVLSCGLKVTIPVAIVQHQQFRLTGKKRIGAPITEYGRLATTLLEEAIAGGEKGLSEQDQRVYRLIELAFGQRYRATSDMLDHLQVIALEDVDPLLGVIWTGDPKALRPANDGAGSPSTSSGPTAATSAPEKPSTSSPGP